MWMSWVITAAITGFLAGYVVAAVLAVWIFRKAMSKAKDD
jgi:hypothetical protein